MITVQINGAERDLDDVDNVASLVEKYGDIPPAVLAIGTGVAVAVNGQVVPRRLWRETPIASGDDVRVVKAVAGGAPSLGEGQFHSPAVADADGVCDFVDQDCAIIARHARSGRKRKGVDHFVGAERGDNHFQFHLGHVHVVLAASVDRL